MNSLFKKCIIGEWNLGISNIDFIREFSKVTKGGCLRLPVKWIKHSRHGSFFADPFIYKVTTENAEILAEEFIFSKSKGIISLCTIDRQSAKLINRKEILKETCHLSYPFYTLEENQLMPESFRNGNWASYEFDGITATNKNVICDLKLIDATPVEWQGLKFIFATTQPKALSELLIYYVDKSSGEIMPHPLNPVKDDIRTARCGGKFFTYAGNLYRVVQDSTHRYGEALHIMQVTELSKYNFSEEFYCDIEITSDGKYPLGVHTLNFDKDFVVIDGFREKFRPVFATYIYKIIPVLTKFGLHK